MPIYEFNCTQCSNQWDELLKQSDPDPENCPKCGKASVQRWVSAAAFRLKGAGWYETDFKNDGDTKRNIAGESGADAAAEKPAGEPAKSDKPSTETAAPEKVVEKPKVAAAAPVTSVAAPAGDGGSKV
jgi:putative FmdB family regulatory protein